MTTRHQPSVDFYNFTTMKPPNLSSDDSHSDSYFKKMFDVHLHQAQQTFNLFVVTAAASLGICVIGAGLLVSGKASEGSVTTSTGLISTTLCSQIAKESSEKLEKLEKLEQDLKAIRPSSDT